MSADILGVLLLIFNQNSFPGNFNNIARNLMGNSRWTSRSAHGRSCSMSQPWLCKQAGDIGQGNPLPVRDQMLPRTYCCQPGQSAFVYVWGRGRLSKAMELGTSAPRAPGSVWGALLWCEMRCGVFLPKGWRASPQKMSRLWDEAKTFF